jgi:hypothetical protein
MIVDGTTVIGGKVPLIPNSLVKLIVKPFFIHDCNMLPNLTECTFHNIANLLSITKNQSA